MEDQQFTNKELLEALEKVAGVVAVNFDQNRSVTLQPSRKLTEALRLALTELQQTVQRRENAGRKRQPDEAVSKRALYMRKYRKNKKPEPTTA